MTNFEEVIDRRGTMSIKWDSAEKNGKPSDILPLWVADMDHRTSPCITDALTEYVSRGIFGYPDPDEEFYEIFTAWFARRYNWHVKPEWNTFTPGVVPALSIAVQALTEPGDPVIIEEPVYYPFRWVIEQNGRRVISVPLVRDTDGRYKRDLASLGRAIEKHGAKLMILCNPHNPVGRVWSRDELAALAEVTTRQGVVVVSDEIHADLTYPEFRTTPFASLSQEVSMMTVACTSPSKTFNIAGLQMANILIENEEIREKFREALDRFAYGLPSILGLVACKAAYASCDTWLDALRDHMSEMRDYALERLENIEGITLVPQEGTYLLWLDCTELASNLGIDVHDLDQFFVDAGLWFDDGGMFGESGFGYTRVNIACPKATLTEAFDRLEKALAAVA